VKVIKLPNREEVQLNEAKNAWKPSPDKKSNKASIDDVELLCKRSILNKLCAQKFDTLVAQFNEIVTDTEEKQTKAIHMVFEKAIEPGYSVAFARMCQHLSKKNVLAKNWNPINFKTLLLKRWNIFNLGFY
jgi:hypothetical protein